MKASSRSNYLRAAERFARLAGITIQRLSAPRVSSRRRPSLPRQSSHDLEREAARARAAERSRWASVLSSAEAKGRVPLACSLLADTDMPPDKIRETLGASLAESSLRAPSLYERMATVPRPDVGSGPSMRDIAGTPAGSAASIVRAYDKALGGR